MFLRFYGKRVFLNLEIPFNWAKRVVDEFWTKAVGPGL